MFYLDRQPIHRSDVVILIVNNIIFLVTLSVINKYYRFCSAEVDSKSDVIIMIINYFTLLETLPVNNKYYR